MPSGLSGSTSAKLLNSWDSAKQTNYRKDIGAPIFHILLDSSWSMVDYADQVRRCYNRYLSWCQAHCSAFGMWELGTFADTLALTAPTGIRQATPLGQKDYAPDGNTALYDAIGSVAGFAREEGKSQGQHVLIVLSDGEDNMSESWTAPAVHTLLTQRQAEGWLCVFLGAFTGALLVAQQCGFLPGNCLVFPGEQLPEAFEQLREATERFLAAPVAERKLLAAGGVF